MRALMVAEASGGGSGEVVIRLARELRNLGDEVGTVIGTRRLDESTGPGFRELECLGVRVVSGDFRIQHGISAVMRSMRNLRQLASMYDVIHLHGAWAGALGRFSLAGLSKPVIYSPHGGAFHPLPGLVRKAGFLIERSLARMTSAIVVSSGYEGGLVRRALNGSSDRVDVHCIPHGVDLPAGGVPPTADPPIRFGIVARLVGEKRHNLAFEALRIARQQVPSLRLVLFGDGPDEARLRELCDGLKIEGAVDFCGFRTSLLSIYGAFETLLVTSESEAAPLVIVEAQAFGRPTLSTECGGARDLLDDGVNGVVVPRNDVRALAAAMVGLASNSQLHASLSIRARETAEKRLDWKSTALRYRALYLQVLGQDR